MSVVNKIDPISNTTDKLSIKFKMTETKKTSKILYYKLFIS